MYLYERVIRCKDIFTDEIQEEITDPSVTEISQSAPIRIYAINFSHFNHLYNKIDLNGQKIRDRSYL